MNLTNYRHGGEIFSFSPQERNRILDFSININPVGLSPMGRKAIERFWEIETTRYPDVDGRDVISSLSACYHIPGNMIALGNGATELMYTILRVLKPSKVLVPAPSFSEYQLSAKAADVPVETFFLNESEQFHVPAGKVISMMGKRSLVYLGNPNNPDGNLLDYATFTTIMDAAVYNGSYVVIDESFIDFVEGDVSFRDFCSKYPNLIVVMSLTKFYAVPGLRIGCLFAAEGMASLIRRSLIPWNVNGPVQLYMTYAARDREYIEKTRKFCREERRAFVNQLSAFPWLTVYPGTVNFILCRLIGRIKDAAELQKRLLPHEIMIRQCGNYDGLDNSFFRLAVRKKDENKKLIDTLKEVWGE